MNSKSVNFPAVNHNVLKKECNLAFTWLPSTCYLIIRFKNTIRQSVGTITFWSIYNVPWNLHANSFRGICI